MKIVLFCEQKYAINILQPIENEAIKEGDHSVIWYVHTINIPDFPLKNEVKWTDSIQEIYDFSPDVIFVPCNIVPYYLPGVKVQIFHGYAAEKKIIGSSAAILTHISPKVLFLQKVLKLLLKNIKISRSWKPDGPAKIGFMKIYTPSIPKKILYSKSTKKVN